MQYQRRPPRGVWIETRVYVCVCDCDYVAPRVGVWIETRNITGLLKTHMSRPPRGGVD